MNHAEALDFLLTLDPMKPRLLRGPAGIGKDALVNELGRKSKLKVVELPLHEMDPPDVIGMPFIENREVAWPGSGRYEKITCYAQPHWWPDGPCILFLNELDMVLDPMVPSAMRLADRRMAGYLKLPDGVIIVATCNGDRYMRRPLDQALLRRFAVIDYAPTTDEWLSWAKDEALHALIIRYISQNPAALDTPDHLVGKRNTVVPTRASWTDFARHLSRAQNQKKSLSPSSIAQVAAPFVGQEAAKAFKFWMEKPAPAITPDDVLSKRVRPDKISLVQASQVIGPLASGFCKQDGEGQRRVLDFFLGMGNEAFAAFFSELPKDAEPVLRDYKPANDAVMKIVEKL